MLKFFTIFTQPSKKLEGEIITKNELRLFYNTYDLLHKLELLRYLILEQECRPFRQGSHMSAIYQIGRVL